MDRKILWAMFVVVLVVLSFFIFRNVNSNVSGNVINEQDVENLHQADLAIEGMYCDACAVGIKAQIEELDGVISADINAWGASGIVKYDADKVDLETIVAASTVYPASVLEDRKI